MKCICAVKYLVLLIAYVHVTTTYEILGVFTHQAGSHFSVFGPVMRELAAQGHNVTVLGRVRVKDPPPSYKHIDVAQAGGVEVPFTLDFHSYSTNILMRQTLEAAYITNDGLRACEDIMENDFTKKILHGELHFDLIIAEQFSTDCPFVFLHKLGVPYIAFSSDTLFPWMFARAGIPNNPSYIPNHALAYGRHPNFLQRVTSALVVAHNIAFYKGRQVITRSLISSYMDGLPSLDSLSSKVSLVLINSHPVLYGADPQPPNVINVGGVHIQETVKPLPNDLEKFISEAAHGVIYVSFGSMVKASSMPEDKLNAFLQAFAELPQRVLWKWENETLPGAPPNLLTKKWMPQLDILSHKNVKVFVSHGGMLGTTEAIHTGVPMLTIPLFGDQFANSASVRESGLGLTLAFEDITKDSLLNEFKKLLEPKMYANAKRLSQLWHDRPMSPMDTAIYWIEYVARHGGAPHLRSAAVDLPLYQYLLLDVIAFLGAILFIIAYINYKILKFLLGLCFGSKKSTDTPVKSKSKKTKKE